MKRIRIGVIVVLALGLLSAIDGDGPARNSSSRPWRKGKSRSCRPGRFRRIENFPHACASPGSRGALGVGRRVRGQGVAIHARPIGRSIGGRHQGCGSRSDRPARRDAVFPSDQRRQRPPGQHDASASHPGSEAFYALAGETTSRTADGVKRVGAGQAETGHGANTPMQVSSSGSTDLHSLVMFVVDANKPFSSPAKYP